VRVLSIVHQADARTGVFGDVLGDLVEWMPGSGPPPPLEQFGAVMVFGGAMNVDQEDVHPWLVTEKDLLRELIRRRTPLLGVCLGSQLLAEAAGATPRRAPRPEIGWHRIELTREGAADPLLAPLAPVAEVFGWHSYESPLPPGATALARSPLCLQAFRLGGGLPAWGLQFHAEVTRKDLWDWLDGWEADPDAVGTGQDPEAIRAESERRIAAQNELGRELAARFLAEAERARVS
jgi:GMP synthase-like glutamine amidotransferase